uniref:C-type lectin domain-containing protein n=1 Tax=Caenorhabditis japonica TaxID=281687 RepID=A0A8R1DWS4_CAEJA
MKHNFYFVFLLTTLFIATYSTPICPPDFYLLNHDKCVKLFTNNTRHSDAEATCRPYGGTLVNVHNAIVRFCVFDRLATCDRTRIESKPRPLICAVLSASLQISLAHKKVGGVSRSHVASKSIENTIFMTTFQQNRAIASYLAANKIDTIWIGIYCFSTANGTNCYKDDGSGILEYKNFVKSYPVVTEGVGTCVFLNKNTGHWKNVKCEVEEEQRPFLCEVPITYEGLWTCLNC